MKRRLVFDTKDVVGFSPPGTEDLYVSRMLIDRTSVGSEHLVVNHFTLKPGKQTPGGSHPPPYDELYYVLRGRAILYLGDPPEKFQLKPGVVAFIPAGMRHELDNNGKRDLELLTVMPKQMAPGGNPMYDARIEAWGTSFKLVEKKGKKAQQ